MASVDSQLEPGEHVLYRTGLHWMAFSSAIGFALFVALVVTLLIRNNDLPARTDLEIAAVGALVAMLGAVPSFLRWRRTAVVLTDRRVLVSSGTLRRRRFEAPLSPSRLDQQASVTGRLLGHGTLTIVAPGEEPSSIGHVAGASELVDAARAQVRRVPRRGPGPP